MTTDDDQGAPRPPRRPATDTRDPSANGLRSVTNDRGPGGDPVQPCFPLSASRARRREGLDTTVCLNPCAQRYSCHPLVTRILGQSQELQEWHLAVTKWTRAAAVAARARPRPAPAPRRPGGARSPAVGQSVRGQVSARAARTEPPQFCHLVQTQIKKRLWPAIPNHP